jgi:hypothetical protein
MTSVIMSYQALRHPMALMKRPLTLEEVLGAPSIAPCTGLLECARRADGGAAVLVASTRFIEKMGFDNQLCPVIVGGGEASGPLYPPEFITEDMFSCEEAAQSAYVPASFFITHLSRLLSYFGEASLLIRCISKHRRVDLRVCFL